MNNDSTRNEFNDFKVKDLSLHKLGARDVFLAKKQMPALQALAQLHSSKKPLKGAKIVGCLHMTVQTAVLIDTLTELGAELRWSSCNIFSTQDHAAAYIANKNIPVYAWKGQTDKEAIWCIEQTLFKDYKRTELWYPTMLLDDGGDLTDIVHKKYPELLDKLHGVSEETTTGIMRAYKLLNANNLKIPLIDVNDAVSKSKNDNKYGCRHSLTDGIKRATDQLLTGLKALVIGYGDVGKGSALALKQEGMIVKVSEIDPICAMQACMDGFEVVSPYVDGVNTGDLSCVNKKLMNDIDLVVTATGNIKACDKLMIQTLKAGACVCNIGHFDHEIDTEFMKKNYKFVEIKPMVHQVQRDPDNYDDYLVLLSEGRLVNLGNATGHPSRIMDGSFALQVLAQMHLYQKKWADQDKNTRSKPDISVIPKHLDEAVSSYMVSGFGGVLTKLTSTQSEYLDLAIEGPFKSPGYRY